MAERLNKQLKHKFLYNLSKLSSEGTLWCSEDDLAVRMNMKIDRLKYLIKIFEKDGILTWQPEIRAYLPLVKLVIEPLSYKAYMSLVQFENKTYRQAKRAHGKRIKNIQKQFGVEDTEKETDE